MVKRTDLHTLEEKRTRYLKILSICCTLLTFIAITVTLYQLKAILVPFTLAIFLYFILAPMVDFCEREWKLPRAISLTAAILGCLLLTSLLALVLTSSFANVIDNSDLYLGKLQLTLAGLNQDLESTGISLNLIKLQNELSEISILTMAQQFTSGFLGVMGNFAIVVIFTAFLLLGKSSPNTSERTIFTTVGEQVAKYVTLKLILSLLTGILVGISLRLIGIEFAMTFGVLAFILNFIPNIGSIIATLLPLPVAFLEYGLGWQFFVAFGVPGVIQMYVGNVLEPRWMGVSMGLHPVVVLFFLFFWGIVWGLPGMFLSVPLMATLKAIFIQTNSFQFAVDLLEGRIHRFAARFPTSSK